ncbi:formate-dependent phosphoribosylglycinamide formyltransferase [Methanolapillus millepedarum]|uniref:Formate-dependent phosphoribosylglycinamide formyltransferase n=1 Tax=Methanolapillus millepedarum TaxID=3028296 RepID=A0AA96V2B2_9EURY|nr:Formate-dependent phosphoribosylglycinamide formyltransferase [Methanosarcinaceae archaeon Ac7]
MTTIGTPLSPNATKVILCGSGELGKEVAIELQRLGVEVIALDRYSNAPAMQVAHRSYVLQMTNGDELRKVIEMEKPDFVVPEIEAIATDVLESLEREGFKIVPSARAVRLTMNREGIRRLAAEELGLKTSRYIFADSEEETKNAANALGFPCVLKPIMSSSGKGQSVIWQPEDMAPAWEKSQTEARGGSGKVIIEQFIDFDFEITLLTVQCVSGTLFCEPVGHKQIKGDYRSSWQPQKMNEKALRKAQKMAEKITKSLGGFGIFGVEFFIKGEDVYFSEVSPRPHDTGMVTMVSQDLSEFALHSRAFLGLPIPISQVKSPESAKLTKGKQKRKAKGKKIRINVIPTNGPAASHVILREGNSNRISYENLEKALQKRDTQIRLFGKPEIKTERRLGVALAKGKNINDAKKKAKNAANSVVVKME